MIHIVLFIYITLTCLGVVTLCMTAFCKSDISRSVGLKARDIQEFLLSLMGFFVINFLIFYNFVFEIGKYAKPVLSTFFDITLVIMLLFLLKLNGESQKSVLFRTELAVGIIEIVAWIVEKIWRYDNLYFADIVSSVSDVVFVSISISVFMFLIFRQKEENKDSGERRFIIGINVITAFYLVALMTEDMYWNFGRIFINVSLGYPYILEPAFILYAVENIFAIYYLSREIRRSRRLSVISMDHDGGESFAEKYRITAREKEVIELVIAGNSNSEIGDKLNISIYTVKRHINSIFKKTEVTNRIELLKKIESE